MEIRIRTHDRMLFKRCRRKWHWTSGIRGNLEPKERPIYFWFGHGGHYALEDFNGYNNYGHPVEAFKAYIEACKRSKHTYMPVDDLDEYVELGTAMLNYYMSWLQSRSPLETLWVDGVPQVEVHVRVVLPREEMTEKTQEMLKLWEEELEEPIEIIYTAGLDRVCYDPEALLWISDYKFFIRLSTMHLETDPQASAYSWVGDCLYDQPIEGFMLQQHLKTIPEGPHFNVSSSTYSVAQNQRTSHRMYRDALINLYGDVQSAPQGNIRFLNDLSAKESEDFDPFIRRDWIKRNPAQIAGEGTKIMLELEEMLDPGLPIYTNATKDCSWDCNLRDICIAVDRNDDWELTLADTTTNREEDDTSWRNHLPHLDRVV